MAATIFGNWFAFVSPGLIGVVLIGLGLQWTLTRSLPEGRQLLRTHLGFAVFGMLLELFGRLLQFTEFVRLRGPLDEMVIFGFGILLIRIVALTLFRIILPIWHINRSHILEDIIFSLVCFAWGLARLRAAGLDLNGLVATSAVMTAIVAFAMQETLGNILGGLALQLDNSLKIGDWITVEGVSGQVIEVHWRHTAVLTNNGEVVVIPNGTLMKSKVVVFASIARPLSRRAVNFSVGAQTAPQDVVAAVEKAVQESMVEHVAPHPAAHCIVTDFHDGSIYYAVRYWLNGPQFDGHTDSYLRMHIYAALQRESFSLARPCLDLQFVDMGKQSNGLLQEQEIAKRLQFLSQVKLFAGLTQDERRQIATSLQVAPFVKNDAMTRQGAVAHWLYLLVKGEADVWFETENHERRFVSTLTAGAIFGEMGMMTGEPRHATVIARTDAECYRIDKANFENILLARPDLASELARIISERSQGLTAARGQGGLAQTEQANLASVLQRIKQFFQLPIG